MLANQQGSSVLGFFVTSRQIQTSLSPTLIFFKHFATSNSNWLRKIMANNRLRNYFQTLEEKDDNEANLGDIQLRKAKATGAPSDELTHIASGVYRLDSGFRSRHAHEIPTQIQKANKIILANYSYMVLRTLASALKKNQTVQEIEITEVSGHTDRGFQCYPTEDAAFYLREILSIPRIKFHVSTKCEELHLKIFRGPSSLKYNITHLTIETAMLDKLITYVCEEGIVDICIKRLRYQTLHNLSRFGGFHHLYHLKIQVFGSEGEELFEALQNIKSLRTLDLSKSIIPQQSAAFLADLIGQDKNITTLNLRRCVMDDNSLSIVCKGLIRNTAIQSLDLTKIKPFKTIDLSIVGNITNKKRLKEFKIDLFNISAAKCFNVDHLMAAFIDFNTDKQTVGHKVDFEVSCITVSFIKPAPNILQLLGDVDEVDDQDIRELFAGLNKNSTQIKSVTIRFASYYMYAASEELMRQLKSNRTLKRCIVNNVMPVTAWRLLIEVFDTNDTLEELIFNDEIRSIDIDEDMTIEVLNSLRQNKSLTTLGLHGCERQIECVKELLTVNPYISFMYDNYWSSPQGIITPEYEEAIALNNRNKQNIKQRAWRMKMNTLILARSYLSSMVPMEIWKEIFTFVDNWMEHFGVFKLSIVRK